MYIKLLKAGGLLSTESISSLLDYVTPTENFQIGDRKKKDNWHGEVNCHGLWFLKLGNFVPLIRSRFFYLLDYITLPEISKCGDREKK